LPVLSAPPSQIQMAANESVCPLPLLPVTQKPGEKPPNDGKYRTGMGWKRNSAAGYICPSSSRNKEKRLRAAGSAATVCLRSWAKTPLRRQPRLRTSQRLTQHEQYRCPAAALVVAAAWSSAAALLSFALSGSRSTSSSGRWPRPRRCWASLAGSCESSTMRKKAEGRCWS
jgi:hypothetical protein